MRRTTHVVIMAAVPVLDVSSDGEYLAISGADGVLKLWETSTGSLSQEYVPTSHLSATCTCLSWGPRRHARVRFKLVKVGRMQSYNDTCSESLLTPNIRIQKLSINS